MKYLHTLFLICLSAVTFSQAPKLINYQGLARDTVGTPITSTNIGLKFEILQGSTVVFTESQTVQTDALGLFSTQIGKVSTLNINWQAASYLLQVSVNTGNGFVAAGGPQSLASVPYALHAASVPVSYNNNVLTIGTSTVGLQSSPTPTLTGTGLAQVTPNTGSSFTVNVAPQTLALSSNSLSISGGNAVTLPAAFPQTQVTASGIAQVSSIGTNSFNVSVPTPTLALNSSSTVLSISPGNSVPLPYSPPVNLTSSGVAQITSSGTNTYNVNVPAPTLSLNVNSLSIVGSNAVTLPIPATPVISGVGIATVTSTSPNYVVNVPSPTYNGTVLAFSTNSVTVAPTLLLQGSVLSSGPGSNSVNLSMSGPFKQLTAGTVSLTTTTDNVSLGTPGLPTAKLDVRGTTTGSAVVRVINANSANLTAALDVSSDGDQGLAVTNTNATGTGGNFYAQDGRALYAQNNGISAHTFYASNTNSAVGTYAGYFKGGFVAESKYSTSSYFSLKARNGSNDLFVVRADGNVGINTTNPLQALDVIGSVKITDGSQADGKVLVTDITGKGTWRSSPAAISYGNLNGGSIIATSVASALNIGSLTFTKQFASSEVDIFLNSRIYGGVFSGATNIYFEIYVDGAASSGAAAGHYIFASGTTEYCTLRSVFAGLSAGTHTITVIAKTDAGNSSAVLVDPGGYGGKLIVKEIY